MVDVSKLRYQYQDGYDRFVEMYNRRGFGEIKALRDELEKRKEERRRDAVEYLDKVKTDIKDTLSPSKEKDIVLINLDVEKLRTSTLSDDFDEALEKVTKQAGYRVDNRAYTSLLKAKMINAEAGDRWILSRMIDDIIEKRYPESLPTFDELPENEQQEIKQGLPPENKLSKEMEKMGKEWETTRELVISKAAKVIKSDGGDISNFKAKSKKRPANSKLYNPVYKHFKNTGAQIKKGTIRKYLDQAIISGELEQDLSELEE